MALYNLVNSTLKQIIQNGLEKHRSFNINIKLVFTDRFQFLSSSLDSLKLKKR